MATNEPGAVVPIPFCRGCLNRIRPDQPRFSLVVHVGEKDVSFDFGSGHCLETWIHRFRVNLERGDFREC